MVVVLAVARTRRLQPPQPHKQFTGTEERGNTGHEKHRGSCSRSDRIRDGASGTSPRGSPLLLVLGIFLVNAEAPCDTVYSFLHGADRLTYP